MCMPTITRIKSIGGDERYRLEGGDLAPDWAASLRPDRVAWCEISIRDGSDYIGSFGGEVWPAAWPSLFECGKGTAQTGPWTRVTPAGRKALDDARYVACDCSTPTLGAVNHVTGHVFVGWGLGWQPCPTCGGAGRVERPIPV